MRSSLKIQRDRFFGGLSAEYELSLDDANLDEKRALLAQVISSSLLPIECSKGRKVLDIKGRDMLNVIDTSIPASLLPSGDEFLFLQGKWSEPREKESSPKDKVAQEIEWNDFTLRINSRFDEFVGRDQIQSQCVIVREGSVPGILLGTPENMEAKIECSALRLGMDLFFPNIFNFFGFGPVVNQTLLLESYQSSLLIRISAERLKKRSQLPLEKGDLLKHLDSILSELFSFSLIDDYTSKLNK